MKLALNGATTMHADLQTDIKAAKAAGFELIEIWAAKLREFLKTNTVADLKTLLDDAGLQPWSINSIEHITFRTADDYENIIKAQCEELCSIAGQIGCKYVVVVPGKLPEGLTEEQITDESIKVLNELGDIAEKYNVGLAFEFLGQTDCSVQTLDHCNKIVEKMNRANIGNVLDTFHFYAGNSTMESIDTLNPEKLFIFHINDSEDLPKEQLNDSHRLYPGLGILPLKEIKQRFDNIGYTEMASIEIFRPEYWNHDPFEVAKLSRENTIKALGLTEKAATA
jgi:2-keto-myo-inositol isomerase